MAGNTVDMLMGNGSSRRLGSHNAPSGVRASSALFVDSDTTPEPNWETMSHHKVTKVPRVGVEVRVPAIDNASDYETDPRDPTAVRVLGERSRGRRVYYEVEKADGSIQEVCAVHHSDAFLLKPCPVMPHAVSTLSGGHKLRRLRSDKAKFIASNLLADTTSLLAAT